MVLGSCSFWTQAYTCFDSSQSWHVLRKRKKGGGSWSSLLARCGVTATDRLECRQSWIPLPTVVEDGQEAQEGHGMPSAQQTPQGGSLAPVLQAASLLAPYAGALVLFSLDCRSGLSPPPTFDLFLVLSSVCLCAPLHLPAPMHCQKPLPSSTLVLRSLPQHIHPWQKPC